MEIADQRAPFRLVEQRVAPMADGSLENLFASVVVQGSARFPPLFPNARGKPLSHDGLDYILSKHVATAQAKCSSLCEKHVTPHVLRHSVAMDLLQNGIDRSIIALWLGHNSVETTQVYFHTNLQLKEQALAKTKQFNGKSGRFRPGDELLAYLRDL